MEDGNLRKASQFKVMLSYKLSPLVTEDPIGLTIAPVSWELDSSEAELRTNVVRFDRLAAANVN